MARHFSNWIEAYLDYTSFSESQSKFHFWTAVSMVSGALRRRVFIDQGYFEWVPNFYVLFVAPPGVATKSTTIGIGARLLRQVPGIKFGPSIVTWQALVQSFAKAHEMVERSPGVFDPMSAMTIISSELGNLLNPEDRQMIDLLTALWDGQRDTIEKTTKTMGDDKVENPWINLLGCTTPEWISANVPMYMIGGGFTSRCIFVYAESKRQLVALPKQALTRAGRDLKKIEALLVEDLTEIASLQGEYQITPEACAWTEVWYEELWSKNNYGAAPNDMKGYLSRKQTHLFKLAIILAAARTNELVITEAHLLEANEMLRSAENDAPLVFQHMGLTSETRAIEELIDVVTRCGSVSPQAAYDMFRRKLTSTQFEEVLKSAQRTGRIRVESQPGKPMMITAVRARG